MEDCLHYFNKEIFVFLLTWFVMCNNTLVTSTVYWNICHIMVILLMSIHLRISLVFIGTPKNGYQLYLRISNTLVWINDLGENEDSLMKDVHEINDAFYNKRFAMHWGKLSINGLHLEMAHAPLIVELFNNAHLVFHTLKQLPKSQVVPRQKEHALEIVKNCTKIKHQPLW